jgi:uncharacterized protein
MVQYALKNLLLAALLAAVGLYAALFFFQERILFPRRPLSAERQSYIRENFPHAKEVRLAAGGGITLHGWLHQAPGKTGPLIIYFAGNGEEASQQLETASLLPGPLLTVNYRGYGLSQGKPGEQALCRDALTLYDWAAGGPGKEGVVVMGRSIGTGVAVYLAASREVKGVILVSPYDSIQAVTRDQLPFLPSFLIRHPFDVEKLAGSVEAPLLAVIGREDRLILPRRSLRLAAAWRGPSKVQILEGGGHNDLQEHPLYWHSILEFLAGL